MYLFVEPGTVFCLGNYKWKVLYRDRKKALVISDSIIAYRPFHTADDNTVTWESCELRKWLNGEFLEENFDTNERKNIARTTVSEGSDSTTEDYVFLLSEEEANKYFKDDKDRTAGPTPQAEREGCHTEKYRRRNIYTEDGREVSEETGCSMWLLRNIADRGIFGQAVSLVTSTGKIWGNHWGVSIGPKYGIRPAMWLDLYF